MKNYYWNIYSIWKKDLHIGKWEISDIIVRKNYFQLLPHDIMWKGGDDQVSIYLPTYLSSTQSLHYSSNAAAANWPLCFLCEHPPPLAIAIITTQFIRIG